MNRRDFVSRVTLGAAAACTSFARPTFASNNGRINVRFLGMMTFVERRDRSFLVATPGQHRLHHMTHVPFLMAKAGSPVAHALGLEPASGVVPEAFDTQLEGTNPTEFVYRNLDNTALEIVCGGADKVTNNASQMAQLHMIAPGKRVRGNLEKWASTTVSLRGGELSNSSGHPDAGKVWTFGSYRQKLTDAVNYQSGVGASSTIRLTSGVEARSLTIPAGESADLWLISAATAEARGGSPTRLEHSQLLFEYSGRRSTGAGGVCRSHGSSRSRNTIALRKTNEREFGNRRIRCSLSTGNRILLHRLDPLRFALRWRRLTRFPPKAGQPWGPGLLFFAPRALRTIPLQIAINARLFDRPGNIIHNMRTNTRRSIHVVSVIAIAISTMLTARAQERPTLTADDYARAERFLGYNTTPLVLERRQCVRPGCLTIAFGIEIRPRAAPSSSWSIRRKATKAPAFDHAAVAQSLTTAMGKPINRSRIAVRADHVRRRRPVVLVRQR